jgi:PRTRC genetic system ThiF family protein
MLSVPQIKPIPLLLGAFDLLDLYLVGCGGTGSFLAGSLVRLAWALQRQGVECRLTLIDFDQVESKNVPRQNFSPADIGFNKAEALAARYSSAYGQAIAAVPQAFSAQFPTRPRWDALTVLVGCVDNALARLELAQCLAQQAVSPQRARCWYLDCGNFGEGKAAGQVLLGSTPNFSVETAFDVLKSPSFCTHLPCPTVQHPELLQPEAEPDSPLSCADLATRHQQALFVNQRVAAEAIEVLNRLLLVKNLTRYATYFDAAWGSARSEYITPDSLRPFCSS